MSDEKTILRPDPVPGCREVSEDDKSWAYCDKPSVGMGCNGPRCEEHLCRKGRCPARRLYAGRLTPLQEAALRWKYASEEEREEAVRDLALTGLVEAWARKGFPTNDTGLAYLKKLDEEKKP